MYDETVTVGEIRRRHLEVAASVLERVAATATSTAASVGAEWADLDAVERAAVALRQVLDQKPDAEVAEEWGVRLTWDDGSGFHDEWGDRTRDFAQRRMDAHNQMRARNRDDEPTARRWMVTPSLIRRRILTLPVEMIDEANNSISANEGQAT